MCEAVSSHFVVLAQNCLASTLGYIAMQMRKTNHEKRATKEVYCYANCVYFLLNNINYCFRRLNAWFRWLVKLNSRNLAICLLLELAVTSATVICGSQSLRVQPTVDSREYSACPVACACCSCQWWPVVCTMKGKTIHRTCSKLVRLSSHGIR